MAKSLEELRAAYKKDETKGSRPNNYYPFWNMKEGESAIVRFLPDANDDNPLGFMVEKQTHRLEIAGKKEVVPCARMYGDDCPICKVSQAYYKDEDKANGKKYWRSKQHLVQVLVIDDPLPPGDDGESHEGKVRYISLGFQLFNIIKAAFESGELDEIPYAFEGGCNFIIKKSKQGEYASYAVGSNFARKATDLTEEEIETAREGMVDLETLLPPHPGIEKLDAMLEAAMTGGTYDDSDSDDSKPLEFKKKAAPAKADDSSDEDETPAPAKAKAAPAKSEEKSGQAEDILEKIRRRKKEQEKE